MDLAKPDLHDGDLYLRPLEKRHVEPMAALAEDDDVLRHTFVRAPFTSDDAVAWVARYVEGWGDGARAGFAIEDESRSFLGFCALVSIDGARKEAEIGYITTREARGRGIGTRMLRLITCWALEELGLERVELRIDVENPASARMAEKAGFQHEGTLRNVYFKDDRRIDLMIYSRLKDEPS